MEEIKIMTTKEVAETLGTAPKTVTENGKKLFPNKEVQRGKTVDWTDEEVTVLIDYMQKHPSNNAGNELILSTYKSNLSTKLTPALKIKQAMLLMQEGYEEEIARLDAEKKALEEQGKQLMLDYQNEKKEHQKDKELVLHKYLTATQIKDTIWKEYGKRIIVSKVIKRIPIEDNDILYKPFMNGNYTGQQPVYHPNVLDKIREIME